MHSDAQDKDNKQSDAQGRDNKQSNAQDTDSKQKVSNTQVIGHTTYIHTHTLTLARRRTKYTPARAFRRATCDEDREHAPLTCTDTLQSQYEGKMVR